MNGGQNTRNSKDEYNFFFRGYRDFFLFVVCVVVVLLLGLSFSVVLCYGFVFSKKTQKNKPKHWGGGGVGGGGGGFFFGGVWGGGAFWGVVGGGGGGLGWWFFVGGFFLGWGGGCFIWFWYHRSFGPTSLLFLSPFFGEAFSYVLSKRCDPPLPFGFFPPSLLVVFFARACPLRMEVFLFSGKMVFFSQLLPLPPMELISFFPSFLWAFVVCLVVLSPHVFFLQKVIPPKRPLNEKSLYVPPLLLSSFSL